MQGRIENQIKIEGQIKNILNELPELVTKYYLNFSTAKEFRSCLVYIQKIKMFLTFYIEGKDILLKDVDVTKVNDIDISKFLKKVETKTKKDGTIEYTSFSYRKTIWSTLNSFYSFLETKGYIEKNPVRMIERPTKKDKVDHVFLKQEDLDKIKQSIENGAGSNKAIKTQEYWKERDLAIFYTFIATGMRESALCEIDMNKIDFDNNSLVVIDKEHKINMYTIPEKLKKALKDWLKKREEILDGEECDALFISNRKQRITARTVIALINKFSEDALGYSVSPHRLRAAYCNIIYNKTGDIEFTRGAMKHDNISTTRIYIESNEKEVNDKVANIVNDIL